jgi:hypothetical protein
MVPQLSAIQSPVEFCVLKEKMAHYFIVYLFIFFFFVAVRLHRIWCLGEVRSVGAITDQWNW